MKPINLTMEGFGPFLDETEIDFSQLKENLTLITGNTGAGKTTIFDAICCALFGKTSGQGRSFSQMRSKLADSKTPTRVSFEFELRGDRYKISRTPGYLREKRRGGKGLTEVPAKTIFELPGGKIIENSTQATKEMENLLGINLREFSQIVMIAQNEFMGMIVGTSKEQEDTFKRIFQAELYQEFDNQIRQEANKAKEEYESSLNTLAGMLSNEKDIQILEDNLSLITDYFDEKEEKLQDKLNEALRLYKKEKKALEKSTQGIVKAENLESIFLDLENNQLEYKLHLTKAETIKELETAKKRAERARDIVEVPYYQYTGSQKDLNRVLEQLENCQEKLEQSTKDLREKQENLSKFSEETLREYTNRKKDLEQNLPEYKIVENKQKECNQYQEKLTTITEELDSLREKVEKYREVIEQTEVYPETHFLVIEEQNKREQDSLNRNKETFKSLAQTIKTIQLDCQDIENLQVSAKEAYEDVKSCKEKSENIFSEYVENSAAFLAQSLEKDKPCPVCGSLEHPHPAKETNSKVTLEAVEEAQSDVQKAQKSLDQILNQIETKKSNVKERLQFVKQLKFSEDFDEHFFGPILKSYLQSVSLFLSDQLSEYSKKYTNLKHALQDLSKTINSFQLDLNNRKKQCQSERKVNREREEKVKEAQNQLLDLDTTIKDKEKHSSELKEEISKLKIDLEIRLERLTYKNLEEAEAAYQKADKKASQYREKFKQAQDDFERVKEKTGEINQERLALEKEKNRLDSLTESLGKEFYQALEKAGFDNETDFLQVRKRIKNIAEYQQRIDNFFTDKALLEKTISDLEEKLNGVERPNLEELKLNKKLDEEHEQQAAEALRNVEAEIKNLRKSKENIEKLIPEIEKKREAYDSVSRLNSLVNKKGESFAQYVLSVFFEQVLERANHKLIQMTDGLYRLRQPGPGKLGVEVYDANSNATRDIKTLSGGETFMASLALALGFSEIVEERNGGVRLDTIFIDEGFGSLDPDYLDKALGVLTELTGDRRVAIISHVEQLKERIPQQIIVTKQHDSSHVKINTF